MKRHLPALLSMITAMLIAPSAALAQDGADASDGAAATSERIDAGRRLFDAGRFGEASLVLDGALRGATSAEATSKKIAQYELAVSLYRVRLYQASLTIFSQIADEPDHPKHRDTLLWLSKLATQLPEPAEVIERVGKYEDSELDRLDTKERRDLYFQLHYLLGRYKYRNRQFESAIEHFGKIGASSRHYVEARLLIGMSYVQLRKPEPALRTFEGVVRFIDGGPGDDPSTTRLRDLAYLSMARIYYSTSVRLGGRGAMSVKPKRRPGAGR